MTVWKIKFVIDSTVNRGDSFGSKIFTSFAITYNSSAPCVVSACYEYFEFQDDWEQCYCWANTKNNSYHSTQWREPHNFLHELGCVFVSFNTAVAGGGAAGDLGPPKILTGTFNLVSGPALHVALWFSSIRSENYLFIAVAIWPVTGQGFQNPKWPAVWYFQYSSIHLTMGSWFDLSKNPNQSKLSYVD